jgi:hypothetical protein
MLGLKFDVASLFDIILLAVGDEDGYVQVYSIAT